MMHFFSSLHLSTLSNIAILMLLLLLLTGFVSAFIYWRRARKLDALLVLCAVLPIIVIFLQMHGSEIIVKKNQLQDDNIYVIDTRQNLPPSTELRSHIQQSTSVVVQGDGLFANQWQDLPVKKIQWQQNTIPLGETLQLDFPQQLAYGRVFQLDVVRRQAKGAWRVQLLAENQQVLAEQKASGEHISVNWLPPVAERMVLQAKVFNEADQLIDQGPIPIDFVTMPPLQIQGRFSAPSFDIQALNTVLVQSDAILDWQTQLGKGIARKENAKSEIEKPNLFIQDAAYFEQLKTSDRRQLLDQVATGASLIILGANAQQAPLWANVLELNLRKQRSQNQNPNQNIGQQENQVDANEIMTSQGLHLSASTWSPINKDNNDNNIWQINSSPKNKMSVQNITAQRNWQLGKIVWLAASNWHQSMISEPKNVKLWWQSIVDLSETKQEQIWQSTLSRFGQTMSIPEQPVQLCSQGLEQRNIQVLPENINLQMQEVANRAEAQCIAFWPKIAGWHNWQTSPEKSAAQSKTKTKTKTQMPTDTDTDAQASFYIFSTKDWPTWQRHQKHLATKNYAQKLPDATNYKNSKFPTWPFILLSMFFFLSLWWREQGR